MRFIFTLLRGALLITDANDGPEQGLINLGFIIQQPHDECGIKPSKSGILNGQNYRVSNMQEAYLIWQTKGGGCIFTGNAVSSDDDMSFWHKAT